MIHSEFTIQRRHLVALIAIIATTALLIPGVAWASNQFTDVPDSNTFHNDIAWLADAGVTKGCNPPANDEFCPSNAVTREQMAAFMHRLAVNKVVDAKTAVTADNADTLDGLDAANLLPNGTPPVGTTARGSYAVGNDASFAWDSFSWGFELPGKPESHVLRNGDGPTPECPGTAADPQAAEGHLCVYESQTDDIGDLNVFSAAQGFGDPDPFGAAVIGYNTGSSDFWSYGTWAVTVGANMSLASSGDGPAHP